MMTVPSSRLRETPVVQTYMLRLPSGIRSCCACSRDAHPRIVEAIALWRPDPVVHAQETLTRALWRPSHCGGYLHAHRVEEVEYMDGTRGS